MPLLSDRQAFDRQAEQRAKCAVDSVTANNGTGFTIEEVCMLADYPMPATELELYHFADICETWGIRTNMDDVGYFKAMRWEIAHGCTAWKQ